MDFLHFRHKFEVNKDYSFEKIPVFSSLNPAEQKVIEKKARLVEYKRGDIVYQEKTSSEAFYVVISGRFRLFTERQSGGGAETLFYLYRGDHFGEISLLTGKQHSVSVEARSDGVVLKLAKDDFLKIVKEIPSIALHLSRSLGHRLTKSGDSDSQSREVKIAALYPQSSPEDALQFWIDFSSRVVYESSRRVIVLNFSNSLEPMIKKEFHLRHLPHFDFSSDDLIRESEVRKCLVEYPGTNKFLCLHAPSELLKGDCEKKISTLLNFLIYHYDYLMIFLPGQGNPAINQALKQSDLVYIYCGSDAQNLGDCAQTLKGMEENYGFSKSELKVIVPESRITDLLSYEEKENLLGMKIFSVLPSRADHKDRYHSAIRYLSRELTGLLVGLALGSGAAYGLSHIGVLRVLEREHIPIDVIAGSSIGALIGAFWASGFTANEIQKVAQSITPRNAFFKLIGFQDLFFSGQGFIKGNQVTHFMESYFGNLTFQDLQIPIKIIGCDLSNSEEVVIESGRLVDALRASISIPGILRPHRHKGRYLIDGGVIDPLPVQVLTQMGIKKIIGVNVLCNFRNRLQETEIETEKAYEDLGVLPKPMQLSERLKSSFQQMRQNYSITTFNVIMNTILFMEYELARTSGNQADVLIHPQIADGHWAQFYDPLKFIKAGEETAMHHLAEIKQLLTE